MVEIVAVLGKEAYNALSLEDHRMLDLLFRAAAVCTRISTVSKGATQS
jgi:hypothetical protein